MSNPERRHILLVEDDRDFSESLKLLLQIKGYITTLAASGEEALDLFTPGKFCCVVMDIKLPGISGVETLEKILKQTPQTKILLMTGCERGSEEGASANMSGAVAVLYKPFRINELLSYIDT